MRKLLPLLMLLGSLALPIASQAQINANATGLSTTANSAGYGSTAGDPAQLIGSLIQVALGFVGFIFFVYVLWAGFLWMTAQGNPEQVQKAQAMIKNGIIGFIIIAGAYAITSTVTGAISNAANGSAASSSATP